uniref:dihydrofolate reductase n=1 Tax=Capra hircus TaxID=9925 RepID=A0A8C2NFZ1_CAPHI
AGNPGWICDRMFKFELKDRLNSFQDSQLADWMLTVGQLCCSDHLEVSFPVSYNKVDMVWIVGGSSVCKEAINKPSHLRLFVTRIMQELESDTFFPEIDLEKTKKALSTNLKHMKRTINVKMFSDLFQASPPPQKTIYFSL